MQVSAIREAIWSRARGRWLAMSWPKKLGTGLTVLLVLIAAGLFWQWWTSWPPYAVLHAPKAPAELPPVPNWSWAHAFSPDGQILVSLGQFDAVGPTPSLTWVDRQIAILRKDRNWQPPVETVVLDMATGKRLGLLPSEGRPVFAADSRTLATTHENGDVRLRAVAGKR